MARASRLLTSLFLTTILCGAAAAAGAEASARYVYAWAGDADEKDSDFLAVIDADPGSKGYGTVVATAPTGFKATMPHHTEYETPPGSTLFADGWKASHSFVLDVSDPLKPRVAANFTRAGEYSYPHSFARIPNGNVLATFQSIGDKYAPPGGLAELDGQGRLVRGSPSATPDIPTQINWPYSLAVAPGIDRVVTTSTDMGMGPDWKSPDTHHIQVWSLSGLKLLASVDLPQSGEGKNNVFPAEPRFLADGSLYVNTFSCGLYRIEGLTSAKPTAKFVHAFPSGPAPHDMCSVPLVYGKYWIQTVGNINGLVVLDASDPDRPVEVSRISLSHDLHVPHWIAADRKSGRIVVTGARDSWLAMLKFDDATGRLSLDEAFGTHGAIQFDRPSWPHGATGKGLVHGALFSR